MKFVEHLRAPASWWLIAAAFGLTFIIAIGGYFPVPWFIAIAVLGVLLLGGALVAFGWKRVSVGPAGVAVGDAVLQWPYVGDVRVLDPTQWRARLGPEADARAFLHVRPYVKSGVEIEVADPADPHPYWLIASRRPADLAAAVTGSRPPTAD